jgi:hypothetical protein
MYTTGFNIQIPAFCRQIHRQFRHTTIIHSFLLWRLSDLCEASTENLNAVTVISSLQGVNELEIEDSFLLGLKAVSTAKYLQTFRQTIAPSSDHYLQAMLRQMLCLQSPIRLQGAMRN